jgi:hypothetical protein
MVVDMFVVAHAAHWVSTIATIFGPVILFVVALMVVQWLGARDDGESTADR